MILLSQDLANATRVDAVVGSDLMLKLATPMTQPNVHSFVERKLRLSQIRVLCVGPLDRTHTFSITEVIRDRQKGSQGVTKIHEAGRSLGKGLARVFRCQTNQVRLTCSSYKRFERDAESGDKPPAVIRPIHSSLTPRESNQRCSNRKYKGDPIPIIPHRGVDDCGNIEVWFVDGRRAVLLYWDNLVSRRLKPSTVRKMG